MEIKILAALDLLNSNTNYLRSKISSVITFIISQFNYSFHCTIFFHSRKIIKNKNKDCYFKTGKIFMSYVRNFIKKNNQFFSLNEIKLLTQRTCKMTYGKM